MAAAIFLIIGAIGASHTLAITVPVAVFILHLWTHFVFFRPTRRLLDRVWQEWTESHEELVDVYQRSTQALDSQRETIDDLRSIVEDQTARIDATAEQSGLGSSVGRRSRSGTFESREAFLRIVGGAVRDVRANNRNPTQQAVSRWLVEKWAFPVAPRTLRTNCQSFGWATWEDFLQDVN